MIGRSKPTADSTDRRRMALQAEERHYRLRTHGMVSENMIGKYRAIAAEGPKSGAAGAAGARERSGSPELKTFMLHPLDLLVIVESHIVLYGVDCGASKALVYCN